MARPMGITPSVTAPFYRGITRPRLFLAVICIAVATFAFPAFAQESVVTLDPAQTTIEFTLGASLHTVHGTFKLRSGSIRFDPASGKASGAIVAAATSGDSGSDGRDKKMHEEVLESQKFNEIVFTPTAVHGSVASQGASQVSVDGVMKLHGQDHPLTLNFSVQPGAGGQIQATTKFSVPYVKWGLKNPSTFLLKVNEAVDIEIHSTGQLTSIAAHR
jgi:polyisoprenoid-binding protein YceI